MKVNNKTIAITGAGNGVGRELTLLLLTKGARVAAIDRSADALAETTALAGAKADCLSTHVVNITDKDTVETLPASIVQLHGALDGLINNAGIIQPFVHVADLDYGIIEKVMHVNFYGMLYMTKAFLPYLLKRPEGHIVNISSMGGFLPVPGQTIYGASKAAVKLFTEGLWAELTDTAVRVTIVFPGAMATNIASNSGVEIKSGATAQNAAIKMTTAVKAAEIIVSGMENNRFRILVGSDARFLDMLYRLSPQYAATFIHKQMKKLL